jgi:3-oxoacyl-[acyl-carrier protein] reductase
VFADTNPDDSENGTPPVVMHRDGAGGSRPHDRQTAGEVPPPVRDLSAAARDVAALVVTERQAVPEKPLPERAAPERALPERAPAERALPERALSDRALPEKPAVRTAPAPMPVDRPEPGPAVTFGGTPAARVALVTGAGRGIGRAIAVGLGRAGLSVALLGRSPGALEDVAAEVASHGVGASWAGADVRDYAQVHNAVERLEAALGEVDLLINNAGVIEPVEVPVWDAGPETWWHVVETDLRGPFHCVHAVVPGMIARGGGRVINLSSGVGAGDRDIYSAYAAAKAGLFRITGSLHLAGYERGLRAFEISPGVVRTDMTATMSSHARREDWTPVEKIVELVVAAAAGRLDAWSGSFLRAGVDTPESLDAAELKAGESGLPPGARRLSVLPYGPDDPLASTGVGG